MLKTPGCLQFLHFSFPPVVYLFIVCLPVVPETDKRPWRRKLISYTVMLTNQTSLERSTFVRPRAMIQHMARHCSQCLQRIPTTRKLYQHAVYGTRANTQNSLQWPSWKKNMILVVCSLYSFLSNSALLGPAVYIEIWAESFKISPVTASGLISYPNICYGLGTLITVPMYLKFGRRPVMLASLLIYLVGLIGCACSTSYGGLMASRIIHTFASGVCEALPVQLVNDIFFCTLL